MIKGSTKEDLAKRNIEKDTEYVSTVKMYVCDKCGYMHAHAGNFRAIEGNIKVPDGPLKVGQNMCKTTLGANNKRIACVSKDESLIVCATLLCIECFNSLGE